MLIMLITTRTCGTSVQNFKKALTGTMPPGKLPGLGSYHVTAEPPPYAKLNPMMPPTAEGGAGQQQQQQHCHTDSMTGFAEDEAADDNMQQLVQWSRSTIGYRLLQRIAMLTNGVGG
jgi:hypothetical protein